MVYSQADFVLLKCTFPTGFVLVKRCQNDMTKDKTRLKHLYTNRRPEQTEGLLKICMFGHLFMSRNPQSLLIHTANGFKKRDFLFSSTNLLWRRRATDPPSADDTTAHFTLWVSHLIDFRRWLTFNSVPYTTAWRPDKGQALLWDWGAGPTSVRTYWSHWGVRRSNK